MVAIYHVIISSIRNRFLITISFKFILVFHLFVKDDQLTLESFCTLACKIFLTFDLLYNLFEIRKLLCLILFCNCIPYTGWSIYFVNSFFPKTNNFFSSPFVVHRISQIYMTTDLIYSYFITCASFFFSFL